MPTTSDRHPGTLQRATLPVLAGTLLIYLAAAVWIVGPALDGAFVSDDQFYIASNPYVHELSAANLRAILDPFGPAAPMTLNYAPVHLLLHAVEWQAFGAENFIGWHLVNVVAHAVAALLLVLLFARSGIPLPAAIAAGGFFVVHPANLEAVAWIFQLKTLVSLALALGALLLHSKRPGLALMLFILALLTKISALFALPVVFVTAWLGEGRERGTARWGWLAGWVAASAAIAVPEFAAFQNTADPRLDFEGGAFEQIRTIVAMAMRYLVMAATSHGVGVFQEPGPARSLLDPWWLAGLVCLSGIAWRATRALLRREEEAVYWVLAAASFAPVSQIFPFIFPLADRYLYAILPGLIGATLLALRPHFDGLVERRGRARTVRLTALATAVLLVALAVRTERRAPVFRDTSSMVAEAVRRYPQGSNAQLLRMEIAARKGDGRTAGLALGRAIDRGYSDLATLLLNRELRPALGHPVFVAQLKRLADMDIALLGPRDTLHPTERVRLGIAYRFLGRYAEGVKVLEAGLEQAGPFEGVMRALRDSMVGTDPS